jgi:hypothetical protein
VAETNGCPQWQGRLYKLDASSGAIQATFDIVPPGCYGGGLWGSPTIDVATNTVYIATGDPDAGGQPAACLPGEATPNCTGAVPPNYSLSVVALDATNLMVENCWTIPPNQQITDGDFGSTVTLLGENLDGVATPMLGVASKNGVYYAFRRADSTDNPTHQAINPAWAYQIAVGGANPVQDAQGSIAPSAYDPTPTSKGPQGTLYIAGGAPPAGRPACGSSGALGSLQGFDLNTLDPTNPQPIWWDCFNNSGHTPNSGDGPVLGAVAAIPHEAIVGEGSWIVSATSATGSPTYYADTNPNGNGQFFGAPTAAHNELYMGDAPKYNTSPPVGYLYALQ